MRASLGAARTVGLALRVPCVAMLGSVYSVGFHPDGGDAHELTATQSDAPVAMYALLGAVRCVERTCTADQPMGSRVQRASRRNAVQS